MRRGFTLIEVLIAITIIVILSVVAIPAIIRISQKSQNDKKAAEQVQLLNQSETARMKEFSDKYDVPIKNLIFYREPRVSDLCVAYGWVGYNDGGPVAFEVNCEKVESLLINPLPKTELATKPTCPPNCDSL